MGFRVQIRPKDTGIVRSAKVVYIILRVVTGFQVLDTSFSNS